MRYSQHYNCIGVAIYPGPSSFQCQKSARKHCPCNTQLPTTTKLVTPSDGLWRYSLLNMRAESTFLCPLIIQILVPFRSVTACWQRKPLETLTMVLVLICGHHMCWLHSHTKSRNNSSNCCSSFTCPLLQYMPSNYQMTIS